MPAGIASGLSQVRLYQTANPAANAEFTVTVPAGKAWVLTSVTVQNVQGGSGTSMPILVVDDGASVLFESYGSTTTQAISTTCRYTWGVGLPLTGLFGATTEVHSTAPLAEGLIVPAGGRVSSRTVGLSATTDYGVANLWVVEYG